MDLDQQIQILIDNAPQDGTTPGLVAAIAPVLKFLAGQLRHPQYYVVQTLEGAVLVTELANRANPELQKRVIYAYSTLQDLNVTAYDSLKDPQVISLPMPTTHVLFQLAAIAGLDSVVFFETPGNLEAGTEIQRDEIQTLIRAQLQQNQPTSTSNLPPDIA